MINIGGVFSKQDLDALGEQEIQQSNGLRTALKQFLVHYAVLDLPATKLVRSSFECPPEICKELDQLVAAKLFPSRIEACRVALRNFLITEKYYGKNTIIVEGKIYQKKDN